jgi:YggT family protein
VQLFLVILQTLGLIASAVWWVVVAQFVLYLLLAFNVVSYHNQFFGGAWNFLSSVLDPLLNPIRRRLPPMNGMDFSYLVLLFGLRILQWLLTTIFMAVYS